MKKRLEGAALEIKPGLTRPGPCKPEFWKKWPPSQLFLLHVLLQSIINLHWLFNLSNINSHFDMFFKIKACMGVIYFLMCVRKHESNLPTNICTTAGEENIMIYRKMRPLNETTFLPYFMIAWCFFFYQSVCFFTNGVTVGSSLSAINSIVINCKKKSFRFFGFGSFSPFPYFRKSRCLGTEKV